MNKTGFGFLRLPRLEPNDEKSVDYARLNQQVDCFLALGGRYFDTAYTYLDGISEEAIRRSLVLRHPRDHFLLADKLPGYQVRSDEECEAYFQESLRRCGVDYFDVFLLHWLNEKNYAVAQEFDEFRFLQQIKEQGRARKIGFSYHDSPQLLDRILTEHPEVDYVQLQINYLDWDSEGIQSRLCYETCLHHGKSIVVMEPVKGGTLAKIPVQAEALLKSLHPDRTPAQWALRFVQSLPGVEICLSGMGTREQMEENTRPFQALTQEENALLQQVAEIIRGATAIPCTGCGYCAPHCPQQIPIPQAFRLYNELCRDPEDDWKILPAYSSLTRTAGKTSQCLKCKSCESHCPQNLPISQLMERIAKRLEL